MAAAFVLLALLLVADYYGYPRWAPVGGRRLNSSDNGLWLRYWWYFGERDDADLAGLAQHLEARHIRYAYFHVRDIAADGTLRFRRRDAARRLVAALHQGAPAVRAIAWVYAGNERGGGEVELANADVRGAMVREAAWLVEECGFDGVQWDYEFCPDADPHFLALMRETRAALADARLVSAAVPMWMPRPLRRWSWGESYFAQVAETCDQLAVMCYDSGQYLPRGYVWLVRQQARRVTRAVARGNPRCRVLLGLPTYGDENSLLSHHAHAENLRMALKGVREGLSHPLADRSVFAGVALFASWTTEPAEWETYRELWLDMQAARGASPRRCLSRAGCFGRAARDLAFGPSVRTPGRPRRSKNAPRLPIALTQMRRCAIVSPDRSAGAVLLRGGSRVRTPAGGDPVSG